jgi:cyclic beta-1,2-glucan synthetase
VPENSLLSHDLFEGLFARCALTTDIELLDDYPASYLAYAQAFASLDARRLADRTLVASGSARRQSPHDAQRTAADRALENSRQPATQSRRAGVVSVLVASCTIFSRLALLWSLFVFVTIAFPVYSACHKRVC